MILTYFVHICVSWSHMWVPHKELDLRIKILCSHYNFFSEIDLNLSLRRHPIKKEIDLNLLSYYVSGINVGPTSNTWQSGYIHGAVYIMQCPNKFNGC